MMEIGKISKIVFKVNPILTWAVGVQNPGWFFELFDIGDYTNQLYGDYKKPT